TFNAASFYVVLGVTAALALSVRLAAEALPASVLMKTLPALVVKTDPAPCDCVPPMVNVPLPFLVIDLPDGLLRLPLRMSDPVRLSVTLLPRESCAAIV